MTEQAGWCYHLCHVSICHAIKSDDRSIQPVKRSENKSQYTWKPQLFISCGSSFLKRHGTPWWKAGVSLCHQNLTLKPKRKGLRKMQAGGGVPFLFPDKGSHDLEVLPRFSNRLSVPPLSPPHECGQRAFPGTVPWALIHLCFTL